MPQNRPADAQPAQPARRALASRALDHLWMGGVAPSVAKSTGGPLVIARGEGIYLYDEDGRRYIDAIGSLEASAIGHGRPEIAAAVARQYRELEFVDTLRYATRPTIELAERLAALAPGDLEFVHFATSGSEAVESAMKIARQFHQHRGRTEKYKIIARYGGYHGCTYGAMALDGNYHRTRKSLFEPLPPIGRFVSPTATVDEFETLIKHERAETIAAILIDPVATASGLYPQADEFWIALREVCDRHDVLLIADEVITGFGRTGRWFASDRGGVAPDIITVSKALSSGYFPISATIASRRVAAEFDAPGRALLHGHTFGGHPVATAAALENLRIIEEEDLVDHARNMEKHVRDALHPLLSNPLVEEVRGAGLIYGIQMRDETRPHEPPIELGTEVLRELKQNGILTFVLSPGSLLFLCPPLVITPSQIDEMVAGIKASLDSVAVTRGFKPARPGAH